jgi:hypothetical protein
MKNLLLKQGWAGRTINRAESADRLNPILRKHHELNYTYDAAIARLGGDEYDRLSAFQRTARADAGKLSESILSLGGRPENGVDMEPGSFDPGSERKTIFQRLVELEESFIDSISAESKVEHQMRTRAILGNTATNARERLDYLKSVSDSRNSAE